MVKQKSWSEIFRRLDGCQTENLVDRKHSFWGDRAGREQHDQQHEDHSQHCSLLALGWWRICCFFLIVVCFLFLSFCLRLKLERVKYEQTGNMTGTTVVAESTVYYYIICSTNSGSSKLSLSQYSDIIITVLSTRFV